MKIPQFQSIQSNVKLAAGLAAAKTAHVASSIKGFAVKEFHQAKNLTQDTIQIAKRFPKSTALIGAAAVVGTAVAAGVAVGTKEGIEVIKDKLD